MKKKIFKSILFMMLVSLCVCGCSEKKSEKKRLTKKDVIAAQKESTNKKKKIENGTIRYANQSGVKVFDISSDTGEVLDTLGLNDEVMTIGDPDQNSWYQVSINGKRGYIPGQFLSVEKITTTAAAVTNPSSTPVPKDPPKEQTATPSTPKAGTSTTKPSTTPSKPSTSTAKPSTPTPTKPVSPTTPVTPTPKPANNCPYTMMVDTTYNGHSGFFHCSKNHGTLEFSDKINNTIMENCVVDFETNTIIKYPTEHQLLVGYYDDLGQVYFWYIEK